MKKIIAAALALCIVGGAASAFGCFTPDTAIIANSAEIVGSGECGENVTWTLDDEGTLTISGVGDMYDYDENSVPVSGSSMSISVNNSPTYGDYYRDIKVVIILDGVTSIGNEAFYYNFFNLTSIIIPNSCTSIGSNAFYMCTSLESITIPDSVTSIGANAFSFTDWLSNRRAESPLVVVNGILIDVDGNNLDGAIFPDSIIRINDNAFENCNDLESIVISDKITSIGNEAFNNCRSLSSVVIPDSVTSIGTGAFNGTKWLENRKAENPIVVVNGILIDGNTCSGDVTIPDEVISIADSAFALDMNLESVTIPDSVESIGDRAFWYCSDLKSITLPDTLKNIGDYAFGYCYDLTSISIPNSVEGIGRGAFFNCYGIKQIIIPDSVINIDYEAFFSCRELKSIMILNPNCKIYDSKYTISNDSTDFNGIIYGYEESTAQAYADNYTRKFEIINEEPITQDNNGFSTQHTTKSNKNTIENTTKNNDSKSQQNKNILPFAIGGISVAGIIGVIIFKKKNSF